MVHGYRWWVVVTYNFTGWVITLMMSFLFPWLVIFNVRLLIWRPPSTGHYTHLLHCNAVINGPHHGKQYKVCGVPIVSGTGLHFVIF